MSTLPLKVVVAEDDPISRTLISRTLEKMGHCVIQASNGRRALEVLLDNQDVKLLVTDYMMPDLDGNALVQILRGNEQYSELPIIMISAVIKLSQISDILELGVTRFLSKPLKLDEFKEYVQALVDKPSASI